MPPVPPAEIPQFEWIAAPAAGLAAAFALGALLGSFLNVVVFRVPRGETFVHGRSRCPACNAGIRARDNVPIVSWLLLRGRCRDCGTPISARYPLVECGCGLLLVMLSAGIGPFTTARQVIVFADRAALLLTLVAWGLLAARGHRVAAKTSIGAALLAAAFAAWEPLHPPGTGLGAGASSGILAVPVAALLGGLAGWAGGSLIGGVNSGAAGLLVGISLGWQAAAVAVAVAWAWSLAPRTSKGSLPAVPAAAAAVVLLFPEILAWWRSAWAHLSGG